MGQDFSLHGGEQILNRGRSVNHWQKRIAMDEIPQRQDADEEEKESKDQP